MAQTTVHRWFQENVELYRRLTLPQHIITYIWISTLRILYFQVWYNLYKQERKHDMQRVIMKYIISNNFKYYDLKEEEIGIFHGLHLSLNVGPL